MSIEAAGPLTISTFRHAERPNEAGGATVIDLTRVTFVDPYGVVGVACHVVDAKLRDCDVHLHRPESTDVARYLERLGFSALVDGLNLTTDRPPPAIRNKTDQTGNLMELVPFEDKGKVDELAEMVFDRLAGHVDPQVTNALFEAIGELGSNTIDHSGVGWGIMAAQVYRKGTPGENLVFAIGDLGMGIRRSLARRHTTPDDESAIRLALQPNVTGTEDDHRGNGLTEVNGLVTGLRGTVLIRTGQAQVTCGRGWSDGVAVPPMMGTRVAATVPCRPG